MSAGEAARGSSHISFATAASVGHVVGLHDAGLRARGAARAVHREVGALVLHLGSHDYGLALPRRRLHQGVHASALRQSADAEALYDQCRQRRSLNSQQLGSVPGMSFKSPTRVSSPP